MSDMIEHIDLSRQVAIVTGGGRGIGRAISLALARAGAAVAAVARSSDQVSETVSLIEAAGGCAIALPGDVTDREAVENVVAQTERQLGPVDLLVNNAGVLGPIGPLWEADEDEWWRCLDVNVRGTFRCSRAVLPSMVDRGKGRIVITASGTRPTPYGSAYGVSKTAVLRLSETLAVETKDHGISVFAISPGFVRSAMTEGAAASRGDEKWLGGKFRKRLTEGRDVPPERAAELVLFLASGRADALTGCFIRVGDDLADMVSRAEEIRENELYTLRLRAR